MPAEAVYVEERASAPLLASASPLPSSTSPPIRRGIACSVLESSAKHSPHTDACSLPNDSVDSCAVKSDGRTINGVTHGSPPPCGPAQAPPLRRPRVLLASRTAGGGGGASQCQAAVRPPIPSREEHVRAGHAPVAKPPLPPTWPQSLPKSPTAATPASVHAHTGGALTPTRGVHATSMNRERPSTCDNDARTTAPSIPVSPARECDRHRRIAPPRVQRSGSAGPPSSACRPATARASTPTMRAGTAGTGAKPAVLRGSWDRTPTAAPSALRRSASTMVTGARTVTEVGHTPALVCASTSPPGTGRGRRTMSASSRVGWPTAAAPAPLPETRTTRAPHTALTPPLVCSATAKRSRPTITAVPGGVASASERQGRAGRAAPPVLARSSSRAMARTTSTSMNTTATINTRTIAAAQRKPSAAAEDRNSRRTPSTRRSELPSPLGERAPLRRGVSVNGLMKSGASLYTHPSASDGGEGDRRRAAGAASLSVSNGGRPRLFASGTAPARIVAAAGGAMRRAATSTHALSTAEVTMSRVSAIVPQCDTTRARVASHGPSAAVPTGAGVHDTLECAAREPAGDVPHERRRLVYSLSPVRAEVGAVNDSDVAAVASGKSRGSGGRGAEVVPARVREVGEGLSVCPENEKKASAGDESEAEEEEAEASRSPDPVHPAMDLGVAPEWRGHVHGPAVHRTGHHEGNAPHHPHNSSSSADPYMNPLFPCSPRTRSSHSCSTGRSSTVDSEAAGERLVRSQQRRQQSPLERLRRIREAAHASAQALKATRQMDRHRSRGPSAGSGAVEGPLAARD